MRSLPSAGSTPLPEEGSSRSAELLRVANQLCQEHGKQLTKLRRATIGVLANTDHPMGAYNLAAELSRTLNRRLDAPAVYRVLQFWMTLGLVTRIASRNAYVLRTDPKASDNPVMFLCARCDKSIASAAHGSRVQ